MILALSNFLDRLDRPLARVMMWIGVAAMLVIMVLTVIDVCGRYFMNQPLPGAYELTEFLLAIAVGSGLAYAQVMKRHVFVEFLTLRIGRKTRKIIKGAGYTLCLAIYLLIAWQVVRGGQNQWRNNVISGAFGIPLWPFYVFLAFGCSIICLIFLADIMKLLAGKGDELL